MEHTVLKSSQLNPTGGENEELPSAQNLSGASKAKEHGMSGVTNVLQFDFPAIRTVLMQADVCFIPSLQCAADIGNFANIFSSRFESEGVVDGDDVPENKISLPEVHEVPVVCK